MIGPSPHVEARVLKRVHAGLTLDVSLAIGRECGVITGPSGAGKTTLLRLIAGLERPDSGFVAVGGVPWFDAASGTNLALRQRRAGMIFQDDLLFPHLSVSANVRFGLSGWSRRDAIRREGEVASLCGIESLLARRPGSLSGGERQRVGLARAIAPRPMLLLCDEPVSAIDLDGRFALIDRLRLIRESEGLAILYVTHSPGEAIALGSVAFVLSLGRVVDSGPPLDVFSRRPDVGRSRMDDVRNVQRGCVSSHAPDRGETTIALDGGPSLSVPSLDRSVGDPAVVVVRADDVLLARGPISGLSARNVLSGEVSRVVPHGGSAEVVILTGEVAWIASVVARAVSELDLRAGVPVSVIIKARSCRVM